MSIERGATSTGQWVLTLLLVCIPIVNIILIFVWAFGSNTEPSKKNWARANIIWAVIGIIFCAALVAISTAMGFDWSQYYHYILQRH